MSNGIDFVIGGTDKAKPAMSAVEQSLTRLEAKTDSLAKSTLSLTKLTAGVTAAYALFKGAMASLSGLSKAIDDFDRVGETIRQLDQSMQLNGGTSKELLNEYTALSDKLEVLTNVEAETTQAMMKQAAIMGVSNDQLDDMAIAAIGVSEAMGIPLDTAMEKVRLATEGNFRAFEKLIPSMKTMATDEEKLAAVMELSARGMSMKEEASKSAAGVAEQMGHRWGTFMEVIGGILSPIRQLVNYGIIVLADAMTEVLGPATEYSESMLENMGPMMDWVKTKIIDGVNAIVSAFTWLEVIFRNLDQVWIAVVAQAELSMLQMAGAIKHTLMEVIPTYAVWFGENFIDMLTGGWDEAFSTLPDIAVRAISEREKDLAATVGQVGANLGQQFADKFAERVVGMGAGVAGELDKTINLKMNAIDAATGGAAQRKDGTFGASINATESRLLTRGPGSTMESMMQQLLQKVDKLLGKPGLQNDDKATIDAIKKKAENEVALVPVT
jgi:hypothetical protein